MLLLFSLNHYSVSIEKVQAIIFSQKLKPFYSYQVQGKLMFIKDWVFQKVNYVHLFGWEIKLPDAKIILYNQILWFVYWFLTMDFKVR